MYEAMHMGMTIASKLVIWKYGHIKNDYDNTKAIT
jgi:hypothetical protein